MSTELGKLGMCLEFELDLENLEKRVIINKSLEKPGIVFGKELQNDIMYFSGL